MKYEVEYNGLETLWGENLQKNNSPLVMTRLYGEYEQYDKIIIDRMEEPSWKLKFKFHD
jgi:hypothetical protein